MDLSEGSIIKHLTKLTIPMIWGMFSIMAFNLADTYFVGQMGPHELAAISFTFPVVMLFGSFSIGLAMGATTIISNAIGEQDERKVRRLGTDSILLATVIVIIMASVGYFFIEDTFRLLGADDAMLRIIVAYMKIWYPGMVFLVVPMVSNGAIRATGNTVTPAIIMMVAAITNVILDPVLIFGYWGFPQMGVEGAALATVIARATTLIASLYVLIFRLKIATLKLPSFKEFQESSRLILKIGIPNAASNMIMPISMAIVTHLLSRYGYAAVASFGVASRIEAFAMLVLVSLSIAMAPFAGQNLGAGKLPRVSQAFRYCIQFSAAWGLISGLALFMERKHISRIFNEDEHIIALLSIYLAFVPFSYGLEGIRLISTNVFNAMGTPMPATYLAIIKVFLLFLPLAYFGSQQWEVQGVFIAQFISNSLMGFAAIFWVKHSLKRYA